MTHIPVSICIPTCRENVSEQVTKIIDTCYGITGYEVFASCQKGSASLNRNWCLSKANNDLIVMVDDDITGFYKGWVIDLLFPILQDNTISIVSARLLSASGGYGAMMHDNGKYCNGYYPPKADFVPTSCVAFYRTDLRFDENFIGSGFEDTDFCKQMSMKFPDKHCVINNSCKMTHLNEMKNQQGEYWDKNRAYYLGKWGSFK